MTKSNRNYLGALWMGLSAVSFASMSVFIDYGNQMGYSSAQLVGTRGIIQAIILIPIMLFRGEFHCGLLSNQSENISVTKAVLYLILRSISGGLMNILFSKSITLVDLGDAVTIFNASPITVTILAYIILGEPIHFVNILSIIITVIGVTLIAQPSIIFGNDKNMNWEGYLYGFGATVFNALMYIFGRHIKHVPSNLVSLPFALVLALSSMIISIDSPTNFYINESFGQMDLIVLIGVGICGYFTTLFFILSQQTLEAGVGSIIDTSGIIYSYIFGLIFFDEHINIFKIIGVGLVICAAIIASLPTFMNQCNQKSIEYQAINVETMKVEQTDDETETATNVSIYL